MIDETLTERVHHTARVGFRVTALKTRAAECRQKTIRFLTGDGRLPRRRLPFLGVVYLSVHRVIIKYIILYLYLFFYFFFVYSQPRALFRTCRYIKTYYVTYVRKINLFLLLFPSRSRRKTVVLASV